MECNPVSKPARNKIAIFILIGQLFSCVPGAFQPVNTGREYGDPVPIMVSHIPKKNQWVVSKTEYHFIQQHILCFNYKCRKMIGKQRAMKSISFSDFKKRVAKNAKKGVYKDIKPIAPPKKIKRDTIPVIKPDTVTIPKPTTVAAPAVTGGPLLKADSLIILSEVLFELNSYKLKGEHFASLDSLGKFLKSHPNLEVVVSGHTDNTGSERHNVALSTKRAEVVSEYLVDQGALFDRVSFEGFGSSQPIRGNDTQEGRSKNRRVEILIRNPLKK